MRNVFVLLAILLLGSTVALAEHPGKATYDTRCVTCHGATGAGDGPASAAFPADQKPADFSTGAFKKATDDAKLKEVISKGGPALGLSPFMAPQSGLTDKQLDDLIDYVKSLKK